MFYPGPYRRDDYHEVRKLQNEIDDWLQEKIDEGSHFSMIYRLCGITFISMGLASFCLTCGAYKLWPRIFGLFLSCVFGLTNFAAIIASAAYRFNATGRLAALS